MRTRDGQLKIVDFGLARIETPPGDRDVFLTQPGTVMGTPDYMAPEQLNGQRADARADVWAFGVVLYALRRSPIRGAHCGSTDSTHFRRHHGPILSRRSDLPASVVKSSNAHCRSRRTTVTHRRAKSGDLDRGGPPSRPMTAWWRIHQVRHPRALFHRVRTHVADQGMAARRRASFSSRQASSPPSAYFADTCCLPNA